MAPAHLQAFGLHPQVASAAHIHNMVNHFGGSTQPSFSFFDGMSSALAPPIPGQEGPTLEQLLSRNLKNWKPFTNDADFKEALGDWLDSVMRQLAVGNGDSVALRATVAYITTTLGYLNEYGHKLVYQYHKAVMQAVRKVPPLYDPLVNGPTYTQAYLEHLHSASAKRSSHFSSTRGRRPFAPSRDTSANKRPRSEQSCDLHPGSDHTNADCRTQQASKRRAAGTQSTATASRQQP